MILNWSTLGALPALYAFVNRIVEIACSYSHNLLYFTVVCMKCVESHSCFFEHYIHWSS